MLTSIGRDGGAEGRMGIGALRHYIAGGVSRRLCLHGLLGLPLWLGLRLTLLL